jgi:homogentisate 1,2-dioxygenase
MRPAYLDKFLTYISIINGAIMPVEYLSGFENEHETEALLQALPRGQNSPQRCPYGLYAEQISGSAFTAPRHQNLRSWFYRIRPSVKHIARFKEVKQDYWCSAPNEGQKNLPIAPLRWNPIPIPDVQENRLTFWQGLRSITTAGSVHQQQGLSTQMYVANTPMHNECLINADSEMMIIPQVGELELITEFGILEVAIGEIAVIPRGVLFKVNFSTPKVRGYVCENYGMPFTLPERGPIGANALANPRDFLYPQAYFEDLETAHEVYIRWGGILYHTQIPHSPIDVVAWHGNYAPYKYDLNLFCTIGSISFDHPDPSIFTVLTSPSAVEGTANVDFVIFPDRWLVAEHSFRPPWYHRNIMSEFMGLIYGKYDAKEEGFLPGGMSVHNMFLPHGPDAGGFEKASQADLQPQKLAGTMAFMWESRLPQHLTQYSSQLETRQSKYQACWDSLKKRFNGTLEGDWS